MAPQHAGVESVQKGASVVMTKPSSLPIVTRGDQQLQDGVQEAGSHRISAPPDPVRSRLAWQNAGMAIELGLVASLGAIHQILDGVEGPLGRRDER